MRVRWEDDGKGCSLVYLCRRRLAGLVRRGCYFSSQTLIGSRENWRSCSPGVVVRYCTRLRASTGVRSGDCESLSFESLAFCGHKARPRSQRHVEKRKLKRGPLGLHALLSAWTYILTEPQ